MTLCFSLHKASGDIRPNGDEYIYHIQLSGITNTSLKSCEGANICQVKDKENRTRKIGLSSDAKYYIKGDLLFPTRKSETGFYLQPRLFNRS